MNIGIVNDVALIAEAMRRLIANTGEHEVSWVAQSGEEALQFCMENRPDLILMDLIMPGMDGVETTRRIMQEAPCGILVVTASPDENTNLVFRALGAGALDVTATPVMAGKFASDTALLAKIRTIGKLISAERKTRARESQEEVPSRETENPAEIETLVAIGASTGGPMALGKVFGAWKPSSRTAVVVVQHIDEAFADSFASWLGEQIDFPMEVIGDNAILKPGRIMIAKTNDHLVLGDNRLRYSREPRGYPYRPSVDVFFHCVAQHWKKKAIGVLLTGMGRDGAKGLLAMREAGMLTIAQDQASSAVYGMPRAAATIGAAEMILPLERIGAILAAETGRKAGAK